MPLDCGLVWSGLVRIRRNEGKPKKERVTTSIYCCKQDTSRKIARELGITSWRYLLFFFGNTGSSPVGDAT